MPAPFEIVTIEAHAPLDAPWTQMTFPFYRNRLAILGTGEATATGRRPFACLAEFDGRPAGLVLAERIPSAPLTAEVLSVFVAADARRRGVATRLLAQLGRVAAREGVTALWGTYMAGRPNVEALEGLLQASGYDPPALRMVAYKFSPSQARQCAWYGRARVPTGATIFPWTDLTAADLDRMKQTHAERPWIHPMLLPWEANPNFDPVSSVGMRKDGDVVGWVLNHRLSPDVVTFSLSFMRADLARRGAIFSLYVASLEALMDTGVLCSFVTNVQDFPEMTRFMQKYGTPFAEYAGQTMGVRKAIGPGAAA